MTPHDPVDDQHRVVAEIGSNPDWPADARRAVALAIDVNQWVLLRLRDARLESARLARELTDAASPAMERIAVDTLVNTLRDVLADNDLECVPHADNPDCQCSTARAHRLVDAYEVGDHAMLIIDGAGLVWNDEAGRHEPEADA